MQKVNLQTFFNNSLRQKIKEPSWLFSMGEAICYKSALLLPLRKSISIMNTIAAITSNQWIIMPPILNISPKIQKHITIPPIQLKNPI